MNSMINDLAQKNMKIGTTTNCTPVSYTHLDVYKRQGFIFEDFFQQLIHSVVFTYHLFCIGAAFFHADLAQIAFLAICDFKRRLCPVSYTHLFRKVHVLSEAEKEIVLLRLTGAFSFREIGDIFEKSENWARVTFYRAKQKITKG